MGEIKKTDRAVLPVVCVGMVLLTGCASFSAPPASPSPLVDQVLAEKPLRTQLIERGATDAEFVHEILHELGGGVDGDRRLARLLAEHLHHHQSTAEAVFQELAQHRQFQDWLVEQVHRGEEPR